MAATQSASDDCRQTPPRASVSLIAVLAGASVEVAAWSGCRALSLEGIFEINCARLQLRAALLPAKRLHLTARNTRPRCLLLLLIFLQQTNQFRHARPVSPVLRYIGRPAALLGLRKQVGQFHFLLRPADQNEKSESPLALDYTLISPFGFGL